MEGPRGSAGGELRGRLRGRRLATTHPLPGTSVGTYSQSPCTPPSCMHTPNGLLDSRPDRWRSASGRRWIFDADDAVWEGKGQFGVSIHHQHQTRYVNERGPDQRLSVTV